MESQLVGVFPDESLRLLPRGYESKNKALTEEVTRMWEVLKIASPDLYLALKERNLEVETTENMLQNRGRTEYARFKIDVNVDECTAAWRA